MLWVTATCIPDVVVLTIDQKQCKLMKTPNQPGGCLSELINLEAIAVPITSKIQEGPPDVIPGLLPRRGQCVIAGETDIGKSLVALEICSALTTGVPLWGELKPTRKAKRILYILGEHYNEVIQRLWQKTKLPMSDEVWLLGPEQLGFDKWLVSKGAPNLNAIEKLKHWAEGSDLVVFDPFAAFVTGIDVENDNVQMRLALDMMSSVAQSVGASCLVLAHQGKPIIDKFGQEHARKSYAIRGASAIEDAATNIFYMGRAEGTSAAAQRLPADAQILQLTRRKYKGVAPPEHRLLRDPVTLTHQLLGNRPFVEVLQQARQAQVGKLQAAFPRMPMKDVIRAVSVVSGVSESTVRRDLGLLEQEKSVSNS